jgi:hypothetical protein
MPSSSERISCSFVQCIRITRRHSEVAAVRAVRRATVVHRSHAIPTRCATAPARTAMRRWRWRQAPRTRRWISGVRPPWPGTHPSSGAYRRHAAAAPTANSAKLIGGRPVTSRTSSMGDTRRAPPHRSARQRRKSETLASCGCLLVDRRWSAPGSPSASCDGVASGTTSRRVAGSFRREHLRPSPARPPPPRSKPGWCRTPGVPLARVLALSRASRSPE